MNTNSGSCILSRCYCAPVFVLFFSTSFNRICVSTPDVDVRRKHFVPLSVCVFLEQRAMLSGGMYVMFSNSISHAVWSDKCGSRHIFVDRKVAVKIALVFFLTCQLSVFFSFFVSVIKTCLAAEWSDLSSVFVLNVFQWLAFCFKFSIACVDTDKHILILTKNKQFTLISTSDFISILKLSVNFNDLFL